MGVGQDGAVEGALSSLRLFWAVALTPKTSWG